MTPSLDVSSPSYIPRDPSQTVLYTAVADHLETFLASLDADPDARGLPAYVQRELYDYLQCGVLAHGFLRLGCDTCHQELLLAFSCKRRGFCPSCAGRRMAQTAAHLVEQVIALGADTAMGRLGTCSPRRRRRRGASLTAPLPPAVLDGRVPGADREGPYDHSHHDRTILCE